MFSPLRNRFGIPGVISVIALVFALVGGAYAADSGDGATASAKKKNRKGKQGGLNAKQKRQVRNISANIAKRFQGTGPIGPQGPAGANGAPGSKGDKGDTGAVGATGPQGPEGPEGKEGTPWTAGGVLPPGETETGSWGGMRETAGTLMLPVSIPLPLEQSPELAIQGVTENFSESCPGVEFGIPTAEPGFLCIYLGGSFFGAKLTEENLNPNEPGLGAGPTGTMLAVECEGFCFAYGSWAATAAL